MRSPALPQESEQPKRTARRQLALPAGCSDFDAVTGSPTSPHAFGATLGNEQARGDQFWIDRLGATPSIDLPLVAEIGAVAIGLAWGRIETSVTAHVYQMWVAPAHRRAGVGRLLLDAIIDWASSRVRYLVLGVTTGNVAAVQLYSRAGFLPVGEPGKIWGESGPVAQEMRLEL